MTNYFVNRNCGYTAVKPHTIYIWKEVCKHEFVTDKQVEEISRRYEAETGQPNPMGHERMHAWMRSRKVPLLILRAGEAQIVRGKGNHKRRPEVPVSKPRVRLARDMPSGVARPQQHGATVEQLMEQVLNLLIKIEDKL